MMTVCLIDSLPNRQFVTLVFFKQRRMDKVKVSFLHPHGPSRSFRYPQRPDILTIPFSYILTKVDPRTVTGRVYTLTPKESRDASEKLKLAKK